MMPNKEETRKNFPIEIIERVYEKQGHCCAKCGLSLTYGYIAHHINSDNSDISEDNCALMHPRCHESEQWKTLKEQREKTLEHIQQTISKALSPEGIAGAALKEINTLIEKEVTLQNQLYGIEHFELPAKERIEYSEAVARANLDNYITGFMDCLKNIPEKLLEKKKQ